MNQTNDRNKLRYNLITFITYLVGIILLLKLFDLQIIQGEEYREKSNTRLTRETKLEAARGSFLDRTGTTIASTTTAATVELYKTKTDNQTLNSSILEMLNVLEKNGDTYYDNLPITINPFAFTFSSETRNTRRSKCRRSLQSIKRKIRNKKRKHRRSKKNNDSALCNIRKRIQLNKANRNSRKHIKPKHKRARRKRSRISRS